MDLFDQPPLTGRELAQAGMNRAIVHADEVVENWSEDAYSMFLKYISQFGSGYRFIGEQARTYAEAMKLPKPPSLRAWGAIMVRAAKSGVITKVGYSQVRNSKAHGANCSLWEVV